MTRKLKVSKYHNIVRSDKYNEGSLQKMGVVVGVEGGQPVILPSQTE